MKTRITNGRLILKDRVLTGYDMVFADGIIEKICPAGCGLPGGETEEEKPGVMVYGQKAPEEGREEQVYDARGSYVMPGIIDIHSDMIESYIQPRSTAVMDFEMGFREAEKVLAGCGITTMFHSISMFREGAWDVKKIRQAPQVKKLAALAARYRHQERLIRHRYHLRYEIDNLACYDEVMEMMRKGDVDLLSFMDHTPGQGQYKNLDIYRRHQPNEGRDLSEEEFKELVEKELQKKTITAEQLKAMADLAHALGIAVASHDDDTVEKLAVNKELGVTISEFPITMEVAKEARRQGLKTVVGAPNILLGGSHSGNLSALQTIREEAADVLVSDYYPQALLQAVFHLFQKEGIPVWEAVRYVTWNPARAVGLHERLGSLEEGKAADVLIVRSAGERPVLERVFVAGACIAEYHYRPAD